MTGATPAAAACSISASRLVIPLQDQSILPDSAWRAPNISPPGPHRPSSVPRGPAGHRPAKERFARIDRTFAKGRPRLGDSARAGRPRRTQREVSELSGKSRVEHRRSGAPPLALVRWSCSRTREPKTLGISYTGLKHGQDHMPGHRDPAADSRPVSTFNARAMKREGRPDRASARSIAAPDVSLALAPTT